MQYRPPGGAEKYHILYSVCSFSIEIYKIGTIIKSLGSVTLFDVLKEVSSANQDCIYFITNSVKKAIL